MVDNFAAKAGEIVLYWGPPVTRKIMKSFSTPFRFQNPHLFPHKKKKITPQDLATSSSFSESSSIITCFAKLLVTTRSGPRFRSKLWTYWKTRGVMIYLQVSIFRMKLCLSPLAIQWMMIHPWSMIMILEWKMAGVIILVSCRKEPWNTSLTRYLGFQKKNSAMERHQTNRSEHPGWWTKWTTERFAISALPLVAKTIWVFLRPLEKLYNN